MRKGIVENFRERMQLRRSLIELEDQNVQNSIEVQHTHTYKYQVIHTQPRTRGRAAYHVV